MIAVPLLLVLAQAAPTSQPAVDIQALVDRVVKAYGGTKAIQKLEAYRLEGSVSASTPGKEGRLRRDFVAPDKLRVTVTSASRSDLRLLDGTRSWRGGKDRLQEARGFRHQAMQAQFLRSAVPWALVRYRDQLHVEGPRELEGKSFQVLRYTHGEGLRVDYWIEGSTHRVTRVETILGEGAMQLFFATEYDDFRPVDGVQVPFVERNFVRGDHAGTTQVERVTFGAKGLGPFTPVAPSSAPAPAKGARH